MPSKPRVPQNKHETKDPWQAIVYFTTGIHPHLVDNLLPVFLKCRSKERPLLAVISSPGGNAVTANALRDIIESLPCPTVSFVCGQAYSSATVIALAAKRRFGTQHSTWMFHALTGTPGSDKMELLQQFVDRGHSLQSDIDDLVLSRTSLSRRQYRLWSKREKIITAEEALEVGIIHGIVGDLRDLEK